MLIDWFTVAAQVVNFLILMWLLKRFLYKPILDAIDAREKHVAARLADAESTKAAADQERLELQRQSAALEHQRAELMNNAKSEAAAERARLLADARSAADAATNKRMEALRSDAEHLNREIGSRAQTEVFAIARKALADLANTSLEERAGEVFMRRLREMNAETKTVVTQALASTAEPALVRSAFDLTAAQRGAIQETLDEIFSRQVLLRFETTPDLVAGIEFTAHGCKLGWSIADYLATLEQRVDELLREQPITTHEPPAPRTAE